jgi:site-specific recombinase XerD
MLLIASTADFKLNNIPYEGFPLLLDETTGVLHVPAHHFLIYHCIKRGRVKSKKSWMVYGQAMYDYHSFLQANDDWDWCDLYVSEDNTILAAYRDFSLTECGLKASTVNHRLRIIIKFYQYAYRKGWISALPYELEDVYVRQQKGFLAHVNASAGVVASPDVLLHQSQTTVKLLTKDQVKILLNSIQNPTHKLMVRLGLATGLRREEIATFPLKYVINPQSMRWETTDEDKDIPKSMIRVHLDPTEMKTKGNNERAIDVSVALMADLWQYALHERHQLESIHDDKETVLFLNHQGRAYANDGKGMYKILKDLGLPFRVHPHMLRHTYATHTLYDMRKKKTETDPLLYVKNRLGHASLSSTQVYVHLLDEIADDLMTDYQEEIDKECAYA